MKRLPIVFMLLCAASPVFGDAISQNSKPIKHEFQIDNLKDYPDHVFFVTSAGYTKADQAAKAAAEIKMNQTFSVKGSAKINSNFRLYAVPKRLYDEAKGTPQPEWFESGKTPAVLQSSERIAAFRSVLKTDPTARVLTQFEVSIQDNKLTYKVVAEKRYDASDQEVKSPGKGKDEPLAAASAESSLQARGLFYFGIPALAALLVGATLYFRGKKPV